MKFTSPTVLAVLACLGAHVQAKAQLDLGLARGFAVLGASTVTNTGPTVITGDVGVSAGSAVTGFPPGTVNGSMHMTDATAAQAQIDAMGVYTTLSGMAPNADLSGQNLGAIGTLTAGVYFFATSAQLTGTLTLDAQGHPDAIFVFRIGSTLTTASASVVRLINGADACNVYWQVGSSATIGTSTVFMGTILALASITMNTGATILDGRAIALTGAVTLDSNTITTDCIPAPTSAALALIGIGLAATSRRRAR